MKKNLIYLILVGTGIFIISVMIGRFLGTYLVRKIPSEIKKEISVERVPIIPPKVEIVKPEKKEETVRKIYEEKEFKNDKVKVLKKEVKEKTDSGKKEENSKIEKKKFYIQVGAFKNRENALKLIKQLQDIGYSPILKREENENEIIYKVQVGVFSDKENTLKESEKLKNQGYPSYIISE